MNAISKSLKMLRQSKVYRFYIKKIPETSHPQIIALNSIISGVGTANKISKNLYNAYTQTNKNGRKNCHKSVD